jgi:hypothetical protein
MILNPCIPTDSFFASLPRRSSVCIGFCSNPSAQLDSVSDSNRDPLIQIASHWSLQTQRSSCVITGPCHCSGQIQSAHANSNLIQWDWLKPTGQPLENSPKALARDIATLGRLRSENGLILIDLGPLGLPIAQSISKLCDGLALLIDENQEHNKSNSLSLRQILETLKSYQRPDCRWLGFWQVQSQGLGV